MSPPLPFLFPSLLKKLPPLLPFLCNRSAMRERPPFFSLDLSRLPETGPEEKRRAENLYVEADEDHIAPQFHEKKGDVKRWEGHVSQILSARMSSLPMGWSRGGADQLARLRVY